MQNKDIMKYLLILLLFPVIHAKLDSMQLKNLKLDKCDPRDSYAVTVSDVVAYPGMIFSGTLSSEIDLNSPVEATLSLKRYFLGMWIHVPCEDKMGSCTYQDLCKFGYPSEKTCPQEFIKNNVPCRCPVPKGNYTMKPTNLKSLFPLPKALAKATSILSGSYKGTVTITQNSNLLSCYNLKFTLYDSDEKPFVNQVR